MLKVEELQVGPAAARGTLAPDQVTALRPGEVHQVVGLLKSEAEDLLDWLEANGRPAPEFSYREGTGYAIRWR